MNRKLLFNGIDAETGRYLTDPMTVDEFAEQIRTVRVEPDGEGKGLKAGLRRECLEEAGWGLVFHQRADPEMRRALEPLIELRRRSSPVHFHELTYEEDDTCLRFLTRHGAAGAGPVDPEKVPYYLLIVGRPTEIPFSFQFDLDAQYAVGRIAFDSTEEYARYARSVLDVEDGARPRPRRATFFGAVQDEITLLTEETLVTPMAKTLAAAYPDWEIQVLRKEDATKERLVRHLAGEEAAAFLFTAGHGVFFSRKKEELQKSRQGALVMSDWPGLDERPGPVPSSYYFGASDVSPEASVHGLISFHFGCYTAGTPEFDAYALRKGRRLKEPIASSSFVARLPMELLSHRGGGALAVVGHVERAWQSSFLWQEEVSQAATFEGMAHELLAGKPVGLAMQYFGRRYADLAVQFSQALLEAQENGDDEPLQRSLLWTAYHDARAFVLLGDPAVRIHTDGRP